MAGTGLTAAGLPGAGLGEAGFAGAALVGADFAAAAFAGAGLTEAGFVGAGWAAAAAGFFAGEAAGLETCLVFARTAFTAAGRATGFAGRTDLAAAFVLDLARMGFFAGAGFLAPAAFLAEGAAFLAPLLLAAELLVTDLETDFAFLGFPLFFAPTLLFAVTRTSPLRRIAVSDH